MSAALISSPTTMKQKYLEKMEKEIHKTVREKDISELDLASKFSYGRKPIVKTQMNKIKK